MKKRKPYRGRICIGKDENGKNINKYFQANTREELERMKKKLREEYIEGIVHRDVLFYEYAREWYQIKKEPFISNGHKAAYQTMFKNYILPEFGLRHVRAISSMQIQTFINRYQGASKTQITLLISIMKNIMASALADGIVDRNPALALVRPKGKETTTRRALTPAERERVIAVAAGHEGLFLAVLYYLGLRRGDDFVIIGLNQVKTAKTKGFQKIWSYDFLQRSKHKTSERRIKLNKVS